MPISKVLKNKILQFDMNKTARMVFEYRLKQHRYSHYKNYYVMSADDFMNAQRITYEQYKHISDKMILLKERYEKWDIETDHPRTAYGISHLGINTLAELKCLITSGELRPDNGKGIGKCVFGKCCDLVGINAKKLLLSEAQERREVKGNEKLRKAIDYIQTKGYKVIPPDKVQ